MGLHSATTVSEWPCFQLMSSSFNRKGCSAALDIESGTAAHKFLFSSNYFHPGVSAIAANVDNSGSLVRLRATDGRGCNSDVQGSGIMQHSQQAIRTPYSIPKFITILQNITLILKITIEEVQLAVKSLTKNKVARKDIISTEFFYKIWNEMKSNIIEYFNFVFSINSFY
uniref:Uncharacterized protein n=2 Tax=Physcomitrium patens TaxID=3218 RepID=A0A7I4FA46_PHYPA